MFSTLIGHPVKIFVSMIFIIIAMIIIIVIVIVSIKHGLRHKSRTKHYGLGIKFRGQRTI